MRAGRTHAVVGTAISIGTIADAARCCGASALSAYDHQRSVPASTPILAADSSAVAPLRRHFSTVCCHQIFGRRACFLARDRTRLRAAVQHGVRQTVTQRRQLHRLILGGVTRRPGAGPPQDGEAGRLRPGSDAQVRKLMEEMQEHGRVGEAAMKAGMDRKTARKYVQAEKLPSEEHSIASDYRSTR